MSLPSRESTKSLDLIPGEPAAVLAQGIGVALSEATGAGGELLLLVGLTNAVLGLLPHANIDFKLGPLSWIFSVGEMHRWHHSAEVAEANSNYGSNFLFWDVVFGTRFRRPDRSGPKAIGIEHDNSPNWWWAQLGAPFRGR